MTTNNSVLGYSYWEFVDLRTCEKKLKSRLNAEETVLFRKGKKLLDGAILVQENQFGLMPGLYVFQCRQVGNEVRGGIQNLIVVHKESGSDWQQALPVN